MMNKKTKILFIALLGIALTGRGQSEDHLKFMGIPIDGTTRAFQQKLQEKGFTYKSKTADNGIYLEGTFAGQANCWIFVYNDDFVSAVIVEFLAVETWDRLKNSYENYTQAIEGKYDVSYSEKGSACNPSYGKYDLEKDVCGYHASFVLDNGTVDVVMTSPRDRGSFDPFENKYRYGQINIIYRDRINYGKVEESAIDDF
ncbi:MAG: hypothetical protein OXH57_04685 [Ekhidna sp.]|nr:hypothetical protein [Ekhidna sp.]